MSKIPKAMYTAEFRAEAVKLVLQQGKSPVEAAAALNLPPQTLGNWIRLAKKGPLKVPNGVGLSVAALQDIEISRLRRELAEARMERDLLKKVTAYFAKESWPGTRS